MSRPLHPFFPVHVSAMITTHVGLCLYYVTWVNIRKVCDYITYSSILKKSCITFAYRKTLFLELWRNIFTNKWDSRDLKYHFCGVPLTNAQKEGNNKAITFVLFKAQYIPQKASEIGTSAAVAAEKCGENSCCFFFRGWQTISWKFAARDAHLLYLFS